MVALPGSSPDCPIPATVAGNNKKGKTKMTNEEMILEAKDALVARGEEVVYGNLLPEVTKRINAQTPHLWPSYKEMQKCIDRHNRSA